MKKSGISYSFHPTIHRMDWYKKLPYGYTGLINNSIYSKYASEFDFVNYYHNASKIIKLPFSYFKNIGNN